MEVPIFADEEVLLRVGGFSFNSGTGTLALALTQTTDYPWDLDGNGIVGASDLLANRGPCLWTRHQGTSASQAHGEDLKGQSSSRRGVWRASQKR
ncbi:MAG: hypothetical protein V3T53_01170 [Phycisphaerales bacterium]